MTHRLTAIAVSAMLVLAPAIALGGEALPPPQPTQPVTTARVGGSPADLAFRDAQQRSATDYRAARVACRQGPQADRAACVRAARDKLKQERADAQAAHAARR